MPEYDENGEEIPEEPEGIRGIRQAKNAAEARATQAEEALVAANADRRELAVLKAGLDPSDKTTAKFIEHYDGDLSVDAMKTAAIEWGIIPEVDAAAAASAAGQQQMAQAFQGGEHTPLGTAQVGDRNLRVQVPAEEVEMWQAFEARVKVGDYQGGQDVLRQYGRETEGITGYEPEPGAGQPQTTPISGRPV